MDRLFATACGNDSECGNVMYIEVLLDILQVHYAIIVKGIKGITSKRISFWKKNSLPCSSMHGVWFYYCYREWLQSLRDSIILRSTIQLDKYIFPFLSYFFILFRFLSLSDHSIKSPVLDLIIVCFFIWHFRIEIWKMCLLTSPCLSVCLFFPVWQLKKSRINCNQIFMLGGFI